MKRMKKAVALVLSGVMLTSLVLCACQKADESEGIETGNGSDSESVTEELWTPPTKLNEDNIKKAQEYCSSVDPEGHEGIVVYLDGIRGESSTIVDDSLIYFDYSSNDGDTFGINVMRDTGEVHLSIYTMYVDTGYAANLEFSLGDFEKTFDKICEDPASVNPYNTSALDSHTEDIKKDFAIIFARMAAFSDVAIPELGMGLKDLGVDFGNKYRKMDPKQLTSKEVEVTNEHKFENGYCTDCGMAWTEYYYDVVGKFMKTDLGNGQHSTPGQGSSAMLSISDQVQYSADNGSRASMYFRHMDIDNDLNITTSDMCHVIASTRKDGVSIAVQYFYELEKRTTDGKTYSYFLGFGAKPGELDKVFESKEAFKDCVDINMSITTREHDSDIDDAWGTMKEEDIRAMMEADGFAYLSKDDIIDRFWDMRSTFFTSLDNGMVWMKTSLKDFGFNWK